MGPSVADCTAAIRLHTEGLAGVAHGNLGLRVEHCPDWSVADLVWHLTCVHRFWNQVVRELPSEPPDERSNDERPADDALVPGLLAAMEVMVASMEDADQAAACWTWGLEENVWFVTRHQVQEAAVHHWDALNAAGRAAEWRLDEILARDAIEEFLTHSVANSRWPATGAPRIRGTVHLGNWQVSDGQQPGTAAVTRVQDRPELDQSRLLLWLFGRLRDPELAGLPADEGSLRARFRTLISTD